MKYILSDAIALRSWKKVPYAYYIKGNTYASSLKKEEFDVLRLCDGTIDMEQSSLISSLLDRGFIKTADEAATLSSWQKYKNCDNRYVPKMNLQITGRCNFNCKHCFNAKDNSPLQSEMTLEEIEKLLDQASACGINALTITGGEPMGHRHFIDIIRAVYERDMFVEELNTNGFYITQDILDEFKRIDCKPLMKISFDGIGFHDWMRGYKGAQERTIDAIKLLVNNNYSVMIQYNINRKNKSTISDTLKLLNELGVDAIRMIATTDSPRWEQNAKEMTFDFQEYLELALEIAKEYITKDYTAKLIIWQVIAIYPENKSYELIPIKSSEINYRESLPLCKGIRGMIAVGANGNVYPCMQMSGYFEEHNIKCDNVKEKGLMHILQGGEYIDFVCKTVKDRIDNGKCGDCKYLKYCQGGCPALGMLFSERNNCVDPDPTKCLFFENGYLKRFVDAMNGYINLIYLPDEI